MRTRLSVILVAVLAALALMIAGAVVDARTTGGWLLASAWWLWALTLFIVGRREQLAAARWIALYGVGMGAWRALDALGTPDAPAGVAIAAAAVVALVLWARRLGSAGRADRDRMVAELDEVIAAMGERAAAEPASPPLETAKAELGGARDGLAGTKRDRTG